MTIENKYCECGDLESEHVDGCERCFIPECGCREFTEEQTEDEKRADREFSAEQERIIAEHIAEDEMVEVN
jgi:hypothetical protein